MCYFEESRRTGAPRGAVVEAGDDGAETKALDVDIKDPQAPLPVVLALHGFGQNKDLWIMPEPIEGCRLIAPDRV